MSTVLEIAGLHTDIRLRRSVVHAVDGVSLTVDQGECLGIVGESGCGKSMTALSVMRLLPPGGDITSGSVSLDGTDLATLSEEKMEQVRGNVVGMVFQDPMTSLNPTMSIGDQIAESVRIHRGASKDKARDRAIEVLGLVGMPKPAERVDSYPHQLSGGMRQRVMIAMALACEPKLLIADEPTTALDVTIQKQILELIDRLRAELGMAVILVTHDLGVIAGRADRVAVMYAGRIVETATTATLFTSPRHPYTEALFEALPDKAAADPAVKRLYNIPGQPPDLTAPPPGCKFAARCRYARDECVQSEPDLTYGAEGSQYRCFFPVEPGTAAKASAQQTASAPESYARQGGTLLEIDGLVKNFTVTAGAVLQRKIGEVSAVADVSFSVPKGSTFGLVGESGCGKTTIGRLIVGLEKASGGTISFDGRDLTRAKGKDRARKVQLMFQDSYAAMDPRMRVGTILREPLTIQGTGSRTEQNKRIAAIVDEVGLPVAAVDRYPHEFSGGQRQRLGLARALILRPDLIVADEPVSALDVSIQAQILNLMKDLQRENELTYLFISHDLAVVRYMSDTIGVMYLGKLVEIGPADDVYSRPVHPYTKGLIDTVPVADPGAERAKEHLGVRGELPSAIAPPSGCRFRTRCPFAQEICAEQEPALRPFGVTGHQAACHFPLSQSDPEPLTLLVPDQG
jgi:peptide/nickel transport system ATP-binding protein